MKTSKIILSLALIIADDRISISEAWCYIWNSNVAKNPSSFARFAIRNSTTTGTWNYIWYGFIVLSIIKKRKQISRWTYYYVPYIVLFLFCWSINIIIVFSPFFVDFRIKNFTILLKKEGRRGGGQKDLFQVSVLALFFSKSLWIPRSIE